MVQPSTKSGPADYSVRLSRPRIVLFNDQQWAYLQRKFQITPRELEIAKLVCQGYNNKDIAESLSIKEGTVKVHVRHIYRKTYVKNKMLMLLRFIEDSNGFFEKSEPREDVDRRLSDGTQKRLPHNCRRTFLSKWWNSVMRAVPFQKYLKGPGDNVKRKSTRR